MKSKVKLLLEKILKESIEDKPKIKLVPLWIKNRELYSEKIKVALEQEVIEGDLELANLPIENLGNIKHIKGVLKISNCINFKELPEGLVVDKCLWLVQLPKLTKLPINIRYNTICIEYCPDLFKWCKEQSCYNNKGTKPTELKLLESENKPKIKLVPLWQDREQQKLKQIEKVLSQEVIEGDLELSRSSIENIGNIKHVKGFLNLKDCQNLTHLPEGLQVDDYLYLDGCTNLKQLPKGLKVGSYLSIENCTSLESLPADLQSITIWFGGGQELLRDQALQMFDIKKIRYNEK